MELHSGWMVVAVAEVETGDETVAPWGEEFGFVVAEVGRRVGVGRLRGRIGGSCGISLEGSSV